MIAALRLLAIWAVFFLVCLAALLWTAAHGYVSSGVLASSGQAILAAEGRDSFGAVATAYPPLPYLLSLGTALVGDPSQLPALTAAALAGGLFAVVVASSLGSAGIGRATTAIITLLLVANPLFLRALADGPGLVLLVTSVFMFAAGFIGLRADGTASNVMTLAFALALMAFSHPYGIALALAALPLLALASAPHLIERTPGSLYLSLLFPLGFAFLAFAYVGQVFADAPWAFLGTLAAPFDVYALPQTPGQAALRMIGGLVVCAPVLIFATVRAGRNPALFVPMIALLSLPILGFALSGLLGARFDPTVALAPVLGLAAAFTIFASGNSRRMMRTSLFLAAGLVGSVFWLADNPTADTAAWRDAALGRSEAAPTPLGQLAGFLASRSEILVDANAYPELVALRGTGAGLVVPGSTRFELDLLAARLQTRFVAVRDPAADIVVRDRINQAFPRLFRNGARDYGLVYHFEGWRVYERLVRDARRPEPEPQPAG
ncbi:hypothetical protein N7I30_17600 [Aurantimonas litoralis]|nr:hypothetical protein [Aurantimonas litoralis]